MTLREDLREAVARIDRARDGLAEARDEIAALEARHHDLYEARTAAIAAERDATDAAKRVRLILYHLEVKDGIWHPGEQQYGLSVQQRHAWSYEDPEALRWLVRMLAANTNADVWAWFQTALDKNRIGFEALLRKVPAQDRWAGLRERVEPRVTIAQGPRLGSAVQATEEAAQEAAGAAEDALADLARRMVREEP